MATSSVLVLFSSWSLRWQWRAIENTARASTANPTASPAAIGRGLASGCRPVGAVGAGFGSSGVAGGDKGSGADPGEAGGGPGGGGLGSGGGGGGEGLGDLGCGGPSNRFSRSWIDSVDCDGDGNGSGDPAAGCWSVRPRGDMALHIS